MHDGSPGVILEAVSAYHPTDAVLNEAGALDRELAASDRSWEALWVGIESFVVHYPSVLYHAPRAIQLLGETCLDGARSSRNKTMRLKYSTLFALLASHIVIEVRREGSDRAPVQIPQLLTTLLDGLASQPCSLINPGLLLSGLGDLGKEVLLVAEDGRPPEVWFSLLGSISRHMLCLYRPLVAGEPMYDGRWDDAPLAQQLETHRLSAVRKESIERDLCKLETLARDLASGARSAAEVFLDLSTDQSRNNRGASWKAWLEAIAQRTTDGGLSSGALAHLCRGLGEWIEKVEDVSVLSSITAALRQVAERLFSEPPQAVLMNVLDTIVRAAARRLEREDGRGEVDQAFDDLRAFSCWVVEKLVKIGDSRVTVDVVALAGGLRTGPLLGRPVTREDVVWRLQMAAKYPEAAEPFLFSLLVGLSLEDVVLVDEGVELIEHSVGSNLVALLSRPWGPHMLHEVRALLRIIPLSPFHLRSSTARAHLFALDPGRQTGSYLHDLKEQLLTHPGPESVVQLERVLCFWKTGSSTCLDGLATPESLAQLPTLSRLHQVEQLKTLLANLGQHVPGIQKEGVGWLACMPDAFYDEQVLMKVAGFSGCEMETVARLLHLLLIYREMAKKWHPLDQAKTGIEGHLEELLDRSRALLDRRSQVLSGLFNGSCLRTSSPTECLEQFDEDVRLAQQEDRLLQELANRELGALDRSKLGACIKVMGHMLQNASLSGVCGEQFENLGQQLLDDRAEVRLGKILGRVLWLAASASNRLAEKLKPHLEDSAKRLLRNPMARPAPSYRELFGEYRHQGADGLAVELGNLLLDDLLAADGGLHLLSNFCHRLMHLLECY